MKKFLITTKINLDKYKSLNLSLDITWFRFARNYNIELIPVCFEDEKRIKKIDFDGVIFSGGGDLFINNKSKENRIRDLFEIKLLKYCFKNKIKTILICRGLQLLIYLNKLKLKKKKLHVTKNHIINLEKNLLKTKLKKLNVNSFHQYTFNKCPKKYSIIARHHDKTIEIIYSENLDSLGLMFHPERQNVDTKKIKKILSTFINS